MCYCTTSPTSVIYHLSLHDALPIWPWAFRNESGATGPVRGGEEAERLMEMERGVLRSMTSCGWFFDDIAGIEARQVLRYAAHADRKSTRLNSSHQIISYAVFCLKKK